MVSGRHIIYVAEVLRQKIDVAESKGYGRWIGTWRNSQHAGLKRGIAA